MSPTLVLVTIIIYIGFLFWLARLGDQNQFTEKSWARHPFVYALALGVYCTSWTFYGLVGTASRASWDFVPILLGPALLFTLGFPIIRRIYRICQQEHIHSIADFLASRYGKRQGIAATTTLVVLLATVPYISLQLKAVSDTLSLIVSTHQIGNQDITLLIALSMIGFALLFGVRQLDMTGYHSGLVTAIAFESLIKLFALIFIASFAVYWLSVDATGGSMYPDLAPAAKAGTAPHELDLRFFVELGLSACAIFCLPRMFHVAFVECLSEKHLRTSKTVFPLYLVLIAICIYFIAEAGNEMFGVGVVPGDTYVIAIPLAQNQPFLSLLAFLGGFSAATAMIIVATITLSQMLSNDVILPLMMRRQQQRSGFKDFTGTLIFTRRLTVVLVVVFAYLYQAVLAENVALTNIGLTAFALSVQLAPAILLGLYWQRCNAIGIYAGLAFGLSTWFYTSMIPLLHAAGMIDAGLVNNGFLHLDWLRPETLFGFEFGDAFSRSVITSLLCNIAGVWIFSRMNHTHLADRIQAIAFTSLERYQPEEKVEGAEIRLSDLKSLLQQFVGTKVTSKLFKEAVNDQDPADALLIERSQRALSGIVGVASSQAMIDSLRSGEKLAVEEVVNMFEETTRALRFNQDILFASFENISSGISVVNGELKLVAWNRRYEEMFNYPNGMLVVGTPVEELVRFNAERGLLGPGAIEDHVKRRLKHLKKGLPYRVVRNHHSNHVIEIKGNPLPDGGYVTTYDDITEFIATQNQLEQSNLNLEQRVEQRTAEIQSINEDLTKEIELRREIEGQLLKAKALAEEANSSKSRFLALASHDILQPINAAQLYANALLDHDGDRRDLSTIRQIRDAIISAETIISSLLEISRLDTGSLQPEITTFKLDEVLTALVSEQKVLLKDEVEIHYVQTNLAVTSDKKYLRRILQNFLSNAVKYTERGKILVGCRRQSGQVRICVYDTGQGISEADQSKIFSDFYRAQNQKGISGLGLGLAVAERLAELLTHPIDVRSEIRKGSCFSITLPQGQVANIQNLPPQDHSQNELAGLRVVYVDDQQENLNATEALLTKWKCEMTGFTTVEHALERCANSEAPDVLLMDFQLDLEDVNGIQLANQLREGWQVEVPVCIISAAADPELPNLAKGHGFDFLNKPVKPAKLRALLSQLSRRKGR